MSSVFGDIRRVAQEERVRLFGPEPEPVEIQILRLQAGEEAQQMLAEAARQAETIRAEAREQGYRAGFAEGYEAGMAAARAEVDAERAQFRSALDALVARIEEERQRLWKEAEPQIIAFVLEIAQRIVKEEAQINRDIALSVIRNALRRVVDTETIRIRVHLEDLEIVRASREDLMTLVDGIRHLEIVEDRRVAPGGCIVETSAGTIDARLETQCAEIASVMQAMLDEAA